MGTPTIPRNELLVPADLGAFGPVLATGGQAEIVELTEHPTQVFKRYITPGPTVAGARDLVAVPAGLNAADARRLDEWAAWPRNPVVDAQDRRRLVGLVLPRIPTSFYRSPGDPREMEVLLCDDSRMRNIPCEPPSWRDRLTIALDCAEYLAFVHRLLGLVVGDINYRNELWRAGREPRSYWIDCDSYRIANTTSSAASITSPGWCDPRSPRASSVDSDHYKLALLIYRMLVQHPTIEPRPDRVGVHLGDKVGKAVLDCAHEAATAGRGGRPEATRWADVLRTELGPITAAPAGRCHGTRRPRPAITIANLKSQRRPAIPLIPARNTTSSLTRPVVAVGPATAPGPTSRTTHTSLRRWFRRHWGPTVAVIAAAVALVVLGFTIGW